MKNIYILLTRTGTVPARMIRKLKGEGFSHVSIALSPTTDHFYSYARRRIHNPLVAGFVIEDIHAGVFAQYPDAYSALYSLEISDKAYDTVRHSINYFINHYDQCTYSFLGMFTLALGIKLNRKKKFTCSQFVARLLNDTNEIECPKDPSLMLPNDFPSIPRMHLIYKGPLDSCNYSSSAKKQKVI